MSNKASSQTQAFLQLLNKPANRKLAGFLRIKAGLPSKGLQTGEVDLTKYDIGLICRNLSLYKVKLLIKYPELFDTLMSLDEASVDFWTEYFIYGFPSENAREKFNVTGCEIFNLPNGMTDEDMVLPKGVYIRFGTNNSIKNLKDFIANNSQNILRIQEQTFGKKKFPRLKPKRHELRDRVITDLFFTEMSELKNRAIKFGFEENLKDIYKNTALEAKEKIIILFVQKLFKNKLAKGTIRSIAETNKHLLS